MTPTVFFIEPGDWESATGQSLPSGIPGIMVVEHKHLIEAQARIEDLMTIVERVKTAGVFLNAATQEMIDKACRIDRGEE